MDKNSFEKLIEELLKDIQELSKNQLDFNFLRNYLQLHTVMLPVKDIKNPILEISPYLDSAELFFKAQKNPKNRLLNFIRDRLHGSFLATDAFSGGKSSFESLPEIALCGSGFDKDSLRQKLKNSKDDEIEVFEDKEVKEFLKEHPYAKYIAIVQADGDGMGKVLKDIGEDREKLREFSKILFLFCKNSTDKVNEFGGRMIYAGGDDLLFFLPIVSEEKKILFKLLNEIEQDFKDELKQIGIEGITLSFGVNISYYKYPMYEAIQEAQKLLFQKAKQEPKNNIAYKVTKHSG
jgi:CRISPR-associated protein Cmr2